LNKISPKKLLRSKWTAVSPVSKERHFMVIDVEYYEDGLVVGCCIEAVISKRQSNIDWEDLKDESIWLQGWR